MSSSPPGYFPQHSSSLEALRIQLETNPSEGIGLPSQRGNGWTQTRKSSWSPASEPRSSPSIADNKLSNLRSSLLDPAIVNVKLDKNSKRAGQSTRKLLVSCDRTPELKIDELDQGMPPRPHNFTSTHCYDIARCNIIIDIIRNDLEPGTYKVSDR